MSKEKAEEIPMWDNLKDDYKVGQKVTLLPPPGNHKRKRSSMREPIAATIIAVITIVADYKIFPLRNNYRPISQDITARREIRDSRIYQRGVRNIQQLLGSLQEAICPHARANRPVRADKILRHHLIINI